ncbi:hypothetical protein QBC45DRAFT_331011, partial [Copromyces sp. CBS 386.78]
TILIGKRSNTLIIIPLESMGLRYRDELPIFKGLQNDGINTLGLALVIKFPVLIIPNKLNPNPRKINRTYKE